MVIDSKVILCYNYENIKQKMAETPKPLEQAKPAPEKNDAVKAWETTEQFKKAQAARAATGEKQAKDLAKAPTLAQAKEAYKAEEVVVFGDSQIGGAKTNFEKGGQYFSQGGAKIEEVYNLLIANLDKVKNAKLIYIQAGGNDVWDSKTEKMIADIKKLTDKIKETNPGIKIVVGTIPPREETIATRYKGKSEKAAEVRQRLKDFNAYVRTNYTVFDVNKVMAAKENPDLQNPEYKRPGAPDVHFNKEGYIAYATAFKQQFGINMAPAGQEAAASGAETPEEKAGELHFSYDKKIKTVNETAETKDVEADRNIMRGTDTSDIRTNSRLLKVKKGEEKPAEQVANLKEETARRMRAYTQESKDNWHTINYEKMGSDSKGRSHEMHIGLGDVLLDPDITKIFILKLDGSQKVATRGTLSNGRNCFLYADGTYAATYTGDKFRILDGSETNVKDKPAVDKYIEKLGSEDKNRTTHKEYIIQNPYGSYSPGNERGIYDGTLDPNLKVVDQMHGLSGSQKAAAQVIEEEFRKYLTGKLEPQALSNAIAGAIANALRESGLNPNSNTGDGGTSVGLFQLHAGGGASRLQKKYGAEWKQYAQDPHINTIEMLETEVLGKFGQRFMSRAAAGASAAELAGIFAYDMERPKDQAGAARRSENKVLAYFGKEKAADDLTNPSNETIVAANAPTENGKGRYDYEGKIQSHDKKGNPVEMTKWMAHVKSGQDQWLIGSSIGVGLYTRTNKETTGTLATGGGDARSVLRDLKTKYWPGIEKAGITLPRQVTLVGLQLNGLRNHSHGKTPQEIAKKEFQYYLEMVAFLKSKGIPKVKISTTHVWKDIAPEILAFNELARTQSPDGCVDITPIAKSTDLHNFRDYNKMARLYEQSIG